MSSPDLTRFQARARIFKWMALAIVVCVGAVMLLMYLIAPVVLWLRDGLPGQDVRAAAQIVRGIPSLLWLAAVGFIGLAIGRLANGRLIGATLVSGLRRTGLALVGGSAFDLFAVVNLLRLLGGSYPAWFKVDVPAITLGAIGLALILLARVIQEASAVQSELDEMF